jgi:glycosyltransferase involved in cell wall biosynthesis
MPPVSVVIPCYNAAATLARTLDSCLVQPEAAQILVIDDASTDASRDIARGYAQQHRAIDILHLPDNGGAARARNWGVLHATHPLIAFIDADDEYLPGALAAASAFLVAHPRQASVRLDVDYVGFPADLTTHPCFRSRLETLSNTVPSGLVIRRQAYAALGGFPLDECFRRHGGEDGALALALRETFGNPRLVDRKRVRMHYHVGIHAERHLRVTLGMQQADQEVVGELMQRSWQFAHRALAAVAELRALHVSITESPAASRDEEAKNSR